MIDLALALYAVYCGGFSLFHLKDTKPMKNISQFGNSRYDYRPIFYDD